MATTLVYDGDCGICTASVRWLARRGCRAEMVPSGRWVADHPADAARCATSVVLVDGDGRSCEAEEAVAGALATCRGPLPWVGRLLVAPGVRLASHAAYRLVAAHRARISGWLGMTACALPEQAP